MLRPDTAMIARAEWIAVDWGTSRLRAWAVAEDGAVSASASGDAGAKDLESGQFEGALLRLVGPWIAGDETAEVLICGMAGSRRGWREAPYRDLSAPLEELPRHAVAAPAADPRLRVRILPGLRQLDPPDVIRGEETQLLGLLESRPGFDGLVCLPGTHSKWIRMQAGQPLWSRTLMTGEIFALLRERSILRHSLATGGWDDAAFAKAVAEAWSAPRDVPPAVFQLRAADLLGVDGDAAARLSRLSGLLIGLELGSLLSGHGRGRVAVIGASSLARRSAADLALVGVGAEVLDGGDLALKGLQRARRLSP